jgi:hypothetical protein
MAQNDSVWPLAAPCDPMGPTAPYGACGPLMPLATRHNALKARGLPQSLTAPGNPPESLVGPLKPLRSPTVPCAPVQDRGIQNIIFIYVHNSFYNIFSCLMTNCLNLEICQSVAVFVLQIL